MSTHSRRSKGMFKSNSVVSGVGNHKLHTRVCMEKLRFLTPLTTLFTALPQVRGLPLVRNSLAAQVIES
jgi:hypothetical protein